MARSTELRCDSSRLNVFDRLESGSRVHSERLELVDFELASRGELAGVVVAVLVRKEVVQVGDVVAHPAADGEAKAAAVIVQPVGGIERAHLACHPDDPRGVRVPQRVVWRLRMGPTVAYIQESHAARCA